MIKSRKVNFLNHVVRKGTETGKVMDNFYEEFKK